MIAQVAELVDAHVSGACVERRAGSSPVLGTTKKGTGFSSFFLLSHQSVPFFYYPIRLNG